MTFGQKKWERNKIEIKCSPIWFIKCGVYPAVHCGVSLHLAPAERQCSLVSVFGSPPLGLLKAVSQHHMTQRDSCSRSLLPLLVNHRSSSYNINSFITEVVWWLKQMFKNVVIIWRFNSYTSCSAIFTHSGWKHDLSRAITFIFACWQINIKSNNFNIKMLLGWTLNQLYLTYF